MPPADRRTDPHGWAQARSAENCVICRAGKPNDIVCELDASWVTASEDALMRGYACLVFRRHAIELHELGEIEGRDYMRDIRRLSAAVQAATGAIKLNYRSTTAEDLTRSVRAFWRCSMGPDSALVTHEP
jgi:hypothetical protein